MLLEPRELIASDRAIEAAAPSAGAGRWPDGARRPTRGTTTRPMGAVALCCDRLAAGRPAEERGPAGRAQRAGGPHVAASDPRRARPLRPLDRGALVLPRPPRARRSGRPAAPTPAIRCGTAALPSRAVAPGGADPVRRASELELSAPR